MSATKAHGPYLLHDRLQNRFYRAPGSAEAHGHWQHGMKGATFYATKDEAAITFRRITSRLSKHLTHIVTVGQAHKLAAAESAPPPATHTTQEQPAC